MPRRAALFFGSWVGARGSLAARRAGLRAAPMISAMPARKHAPGARPRPAARAAAEARTAGAATPAVNAAPAATKTARPSVAAPPAASHHEASARVLRRFRSVFNAVKTHFQQVEKKVGVGGAQVWALSLVRAQPGIGVGALARAMDVHQTTASNLVRALVEQGLVESHRSGVDRRAAQLKVTRTGIRLLDRAPGPFSGVLPEALQRLDPATLERLDADLSALLRLLHPDRGAEHIPLAQM